MKLLSSNCLLLPLFGLIGVGDAAASNNLNFVIGDRVMALPNEFNMYITNDDRTLTLVTDPSFRERKGLRQIIIRKNVDKDKIISAASFLEKPSIRSSCGMTVIEGRASYVEAFTIIQIESISIMIAEQDRVISKVAESTLCATAP